MFSRATLKSYGFKGFVKVKDFTLEVTSTIPKTRGVYIVYSNDLERSLSDVSPAGRYKGKDPTLDRAVLKSLWVSNANVLYIGQTNRSLRKRIYEFIRFSRGEPVPHRGGRAIWQLKDHENLEIAWKELPKDNPREVEKQLISDFKRLYVGKRPFANFRD